LVIAPSILAVLAVATLVALVKARAAAKRVDELSEAYWQLRYEYGQMAARLRRLEDSASPQADDEAPGQRQVTNVANVPTAFVPLSSLKR
jgi:type II secretory pathway component PulJ